jgi:hypothetical protein
VALPIKLKKLTLAGLGNLFHWQAAAITKVTGITKISK